MRSPIAVLGTSYFSGIGIFAINEEYVVVAFVDDKGNHSNVKKVELLNDNLECSCGLDECDCGIFYSFIYQGNEYDLSEFMRAYY
jgi:hypothetical protein